MTADRDVSFPLAAVLVGLTLVACGDPTLTLTSGEFALVVGQRATVEVVEGGDGAELDLSSLTLTDAAEQVFRSTSPTFEVERSRARAVEFVVPPGVAPGEATLEVKTVEGPAFTGTIQLNRLTAVRDGEGVIWLLALQGDGQLAQFTEIGAAQAGAGGGLLAIGDKGRLLASVPAQDSQLRLAWLGSSPQLPPPSALGVTGAVNALAVSASGRTLVGTDLGTLVVKRPEDPSAPLEVEATLDTQRTVAVAADQLGKGAVALSLDGADRVVIRPINLIEDPPQVLFSIELSWSGVADSSLSMAVSPDAKTIVVVDGTNGRVAMVHEGSIEAVTEIFPNGEAGAVGITSSKDGSIFFVLNRATHNVSLIRVAAGSLAFDPPIALPGAASDSSGAAIAIQASTNDEVIVLREHGLLTVDPSSSAVTELELPRLFTDKESGELGNALAIQP